MQECESILNRLSLELDHRLSDSEQVQFQADLSAHEECLPLVGSLRWADAALRASPLLAPEHDLVPAVVAGAEQAEERRSRRMLGLTLLMGSTVSAGLVLAIGLVIMTAVLSFLAPGAVQIMVTFLAGILSTLYALVLALGAAENLLGPVLTPILMALAGVFILSLTLAWANRLSAVSPYVEAS